ncbi:MAG: hypothetical protein WAV05_18560 [Anaerolineales bacterium]
MTAWGGKTSIARGFSIFTGETILDNCKAPVGQASTQISQEEHFS